MLLNATIFCFVGQAPLLLSNPSCPFPSLSLLRLPVLKHEDKVPVGGSKRKTFVKATLR